MAPSPARLCLSIAAGADAHGSGKGSGEVGLTGEPAGLGDLRETIGSVRQLLPRRVEAPFAQIGVRTRANCLLEDSSEMEDAYTGDISHVGKRQILLEILVDEGQHAVEPTSIQRSLPAWRIGSTSAFRVVLGERGDQVERERVHAQPPGRPFTA